MYEDEREVMEENKKREEEKKAGPMPGCTGDSWP